MKKSNLTMKYKYGNQDEEHVFLYKGRPFVALVSTHLPTPNSTYIDHLLCAELGLKLSDIQCKKMSFAGQKLRLLGKISCTVQCVLDGNIFGSYQLKNPSNVTEIYPEVFFNYLLSQIPWQNYTQFV